MFVVACKKTQTTYTTLTRSLQYEWTFTMRVNSGCGPLIMELEHCLFSCFLPVVFGAEVSSVDRQIFALPLRYGGLAIVNPADYCYKSSLHSTALLQSSSCFFDIVWNPHTLELSLLLRNCAACRVVGKGGYGWTRTQTWTQTEEF